MRDEILQILNSYPGDAFQDEKFENGNTYLIGDRDEVLEKLQAAMCYREVKAIMSWHQFASYPDYSMDIIYQLHDIYAPSLILSSIEKVKSEST